MSEGIEVQPHRLENPLAPLLTALRYCWLIVKKVSDFLLAACTHPSIGLGFCLVVAALIFSGEPLSIQIADRAPIVYQFEANPPLGAALLYLVVWLLFYLIAKTVWPTVKVGYRKVTRRENGSEQE